MLGVQPLGREPAALRLEELWNDLAQQETFALLCAYPIAHFDNAAYAQPFADINASHTVVTPAESYSIVEADEAYLTQSMMDPALRVVEGFQPVMPSFQGKLAGPEVAALLEYIKSLQSDAVRTGPSEGPAYAPIRGR